MTYDVVIVGTGPAGVSAAWPLIQSGMKVLLIDASVEERSAPPVGEYFDLRRRDEQQAGWMIGSDIGAWLAQSASSPKLRVPTLRSVFDGFLEANRIETSNFTAVGSLAAGGLSNAWGCGVARYGPAELQDFPVGPAELDESFASISRRIGLSGRSDDALTDYFGVDEWAEPGPTLDDHAKYMLRRFGDGRAVSRLRNVRLGRARLALLNSGLGDRKGCDLSGLCLWGCARGALYSSRTELPALVKAGADIRQGVVVDHLEQRNETWRVRGRKRINGASVEVGARRIVLAAGTLATTAIAWRTLKQRCEPRALLSNPTAAFLLLRPSALGRIPTKGPAFGQVAFVMDLPSVGAEAYGGLFSPAHIPAHEFIRHIPLSRGVARTVWRMLAPATFVGNAFLPSNLNRHLAELTAEGKLSIRGGHSQALPKVVQALARSWREAASSLGALVMPGSFSVGLPGSDIHYAGTLPMKSNPGRGETTATAELIGAPGVFVADAACFPSISTKPHTLTMMALADRMAKAMLRA